MPVPVFRLPIAPFAVAALVAVLLAFAPLPRAQDNPGGAIVAVIEDQLSAFQRQDLDAAFAHAAPNIQGLFVSPQNFGDMVRLGYPMVWRPRSHSIEGLTPTPGGYVQTVLFEDTDGRLFHADYEMVQVDGRWRIAGVQLRKAEGYGI